MSDGVLNVGSQAISDLGCLKIVGRPDEEGLQERAVIPPSLIVGRRSSQLKLQHIAE